MKKKHFGTFLVLAALLLLVAGTVVWAQSSANYALNWSVMGNGGGDASSTSYAVSGTVGQSLVGRTLSGSSFEMSSGYWTASATTQIYLPTIINN